jgi:hypothetical protein
MAMPNGKIEVHLICKDGSFGNDGDVVIKERLNNLINFTLEILDKFFEIGL